MADFNDPKSGTLGSGLAQNAGAQINWREAYRQYSIGEQSEGRAPLPIQDFVKNMNEELQRRQKMQPSAQTPAPVTAPRGGLMDSIRGLFR